MQQNCYLSVVLTFQKNFDRDQLLTTAITSQK